MLQHPELFSLGSVFRLNLVSLCLSCQPVVTGSISYSAGTASAAWGLLLQRLRRRWRWIIQHSAADWDSCHGIVTP